MDLTEAFAPGGGNEDLEKTDFFDFVVSPPPQQHCASADGISDEESLLHRTTCRTMDFLHDRQLNVEDHDQRELHGTSFIKETNNNTLTALPPVSTITSSLNHHHARNHNCGNIETDQISMEQSDCDYWSTAVGTDNKESACNILLEDLNKYCWSGHTNSHQSLAGQTTDTIDVNPVNDSVSRVCSENDRQNTDGAIYTLTVLNNETDSMDALDCCKSPVPAVSDSWSLRPNLDLDAILSLEPASAPDQQDHDRTRLDGSINSERFHAISGTPSQYSTEDSGFVESKELCGVGGRSLSNGLGDNNNDWKLSDQNHLNKVAAVSATNVSSADSAESLLRSALQGKLYTGSTQVVSSSSQANSTMSLTATSNAGNALQIITEHHQQQQHQHQQESQQPSEDEVINTCTDEDLILSQLDTQTYRPGDYEKLKIIANEVVESYCSLEPVCNVSATTTLMYTLDPNCGSLGTITLPGDLGQVGTVTVVTASSLSQQEMLQQAVTRTEIDQQQQQQQQQVTTNQTATARIVPGGGGGSSGSSTTKSGKKYCRRKNNSSSSPSGANSNASSLLNSSSGNSTCSNTSANQQQSTGSGTSPSSVQRKERSLHYCSICSKGFKDKYSVNVHIRTHTGEKPFACSLCGKSFRQKAHLAKHYQTHVAQKPNVANSNNSNTVGINSNTNSNSSSADMSTGRAQPQLVPTIATTCNPSN